jgi:hypothetical protein
MKLKSQTFFGAWGKIQDLYYKTLSLFYDQGDPNLARPHAERLDRLLREADPEQETVFGEGCRSLIEEIRGNLCEAIKHREKEISLIDRLYELAHDSDTAEYVRAEYDCDDIHQRLNMLAILYHHIGDTQKAISILEASKRHCAKWGIRFEGEELLRDYLGESTNRTLEYSFSENGALRVVHSPTGFHPTGGGLVAFVIRPESARQSPAAVVDARDRQPAQVVVEEP